MNNPEWLDVLHLLVESVHVQGLGMGLTTA